jgi:hypothetical protein
MPIFLVPPYFRTFRQPFTGTDGVWQSRVDESETLGVQLRDEAPSAAPLGETAVQGRAPASHTGIGVPAPDNEG